MTLLLDRHGLDARSAAASGPLRDLSASLAADLRKVVERPLFIPDGKALLSRVGGRCARDATMLDFDPFSPHEHKCPRCGEVYRGELHDGFWIYWYQLWLAERAVHAAALSRLGVLPEAARLANDILDGYCDRYLGYPNVDNALGPTRPFFSTYLESIWLLQLCIAASLLDSSAHRRVVDRFKASVVEPSLALIESFDEGMSNRQVWNNAALMAGHLVLGRPERAEEILRARSGVAFHLRSALLGDGTWYEGENYHLFAHRGLWYAMQMTETAGFELPPELDARFDRGFVAPFLTVLPDLTFPSRRDSQYAISIRQWRFAEVCELGLARRPDRLLQATLSRLYADDLPPGDTGRWRSTAEAERNLRPVGLRRSDLGWKSLLFAGETVDLHSGRPLPSVLLDGQGLGVLRRDHGRVYAAVDYGVSGGGHGHPDRLNLILMDGERRILDDMGSGSYVDPLLHWYRSTLAHNAPMLDGRSQPRVDGTLVAFEDRGAAGWISAIAPLAHDATVTRTAVVMPDYVLDEVVWSSPRDRQLDLPLHIDAAPRESRSPAAGTLTGGDGLEDGFRFVRNAGQIATIAANETMAFAGPLAELWVGANVPVQVWRGVAPGAPGRDDAAFLLLRAVSANGVVRTAWSWKAGVRSAELFPAIALTTPSERHEHSRVDHGWAVTIHVNGAKSTIDLEGLVPAREVNRDVGLANVELREAKLPPTRLAHGEFLRATLGKDAYRRSEQSWIEAGSPAADVTLTNDGGALRISADVRADRSFVAPGSSNWLDNEHADINGAGLQLYLRSAASSAGYVIVPIEASDSVAIRPIDGWGDSIPVQGTWKATREGYHVALVVKPPTTELSVNLIVNEKPHGRERRRGQLVLSGNDGGWVYLRGDRHDSSLLKHLRLEP